MISNRVLSGLGLAVALLLWVSGLFSFWVLSLATAVAIIGFLAVQLTPSFTRPILVVMGIVILVAFGAVAVRTSLFTNEKDRFSYPALGNSRLEADMEWAERIDPYARELRGSLATKCRNTETEVTEQINGRMMAVAANDFLRPAQVKRVQREITRLQKFRAKCREAIVQEKAPREEVPSQIASAGVSPADKGLGFFSSIGSALANTFSGVRSAIPFFTSKSGFITLLGVIFIVIGWPVGKAHKAFGGGIMAAGIVMVLAGAGDWLSSQNSLFAQLRNGIMGDYNYPWYVTVLALTGISVLVSALFGVETKVRFSTIVVAVLLLGIAWIARPDTTLRDASNRIEAKLGGVNISAPLEKIFGGTPTVPCREHDAVFRDADIGQLVRCFQRMERGDETVIQLHGGHWGVNPSDAPIRVIAWFEGREVYRGVYRSSGLPIIDRIMILAQAPTDIMVNMRKLDSAAKARR